LEDLLEVKRREIKYRISLPEAFTLMRSMARLMPEDAHNSGWEGYMVRSLYFDSIDNVDLEEKKDGLEKRRKLRLRIYSSDDATAKLELKEKSGVWQRKRSISLSRHDAQLIMRGDHGLLADMENILALQIYSLIRSEVRRPCCLVQYNRFAFVAHANDIRVSFDMKLSTSENPYGLFDSRPCLYPVGSYDDVTLEVKYNHFLLDYVKDLLRCCDRVPISYSKYVMARSLCHQCV
jgi:hypothetical protein